MDHTVPRELGGNLEAGNFSCIFWVLAKLLNFKIVNQLVQKFQKSQVGFEHLSGQPFKKVKLPKKNSKFTFFGPLAIFLRNLTFLKMST